MLKPQLLLACDFDGTVTRQDTLVEILDAFGDSHWRQIQEKVVKGDLNIRQGLLLEMGKIRASWDQLKALLDTQVQVEPSFPPFLKRMREKGVPVVLLTGGFDLLVETVLKKSGLHYLPLLANRLVPLDGVGQISKDPTDIPWSVEFPYLSESCPDCGHCKADPIQRWNSQGYTTVFVGNGVTDRCPARVARLTFAREELRRWCLSQGIEATEFKDFADIEQGLKTLGWL